MKKLNLPVVKGKLPQGKHLSMNDYLKFVFLHLKYTYNKRTNRLWKKKLAVSIPFTIK